MLLVVIVVRCAEEKGFPVIWYEPVLGDMVDVLTRTGIPGEFYIRVSEHDGHTSANQINRNPILW